MLRVAIDTGGTFTDFVFQDLETGGKTFWKTLSTPAQPEQAVMSGITHLTGSLGVKLSQVREILLATTVATNAIIERKGSLTGLITTEGFRDVLIIGREKRHDGYDLFLDKPAPLAQRRNIQEVGERTAYDGEIVRPLDMDSVSRAIDVLLANGVESIAVTLLHSYANPLHEKAVSEQIRARAPQISLSLSSEVSPKYREYERTSTTVANAYVKPIVERYIGGLEKVFADQGFRGDLYAMQSNGGLMTPELAKKYPITIVESGPSAGVLMCSIVGRAEGFANVLTFDMGGTTAKVGAMEGGEPAVTQSIEVDGVNLRKYSGLPLNIPAIELIEIGAGGGSIATVEMGLIRVGPESAGADPGPICYGKGGSRATLTDANLVLGYIDPGNFAGGSMKLDVEAAERGIMEHIGEPLGLSLPDAAWGIHAVANASMERAMRSMSMDRGRDPRNYAMVAFGGAGPLHAARLAKALGVPHVIVPWGAGVGSAVGLLEADPKFSVSQTNLLAISCDTAHDTAYGTGEGAAEGAVKNTAGDSSHAIAAIYAGLEERVKNEVRQIDKAERVEWRRFAYLRYQGQGYELKIDLPCGPIGPGYARRVNDIFNATYQTTYGYSQAESLIEAADWYLTATLPTGISPDKAEDAAAALVEPKLSAGTPADTPTRANGGGELKMRKAYFQDCGDFSQCQVVDRYALRAGDRVAGPAIVEERESTTVILPGNVAHVAAAGHLIISMSSPAGDT